MNYLARVCVSLTLVFAVLATPPRPNLVGSKFHIEDLEFLQDHLGRKIPKSLSPDDIMDKAEDLKELLEDLRYFIAPGLASDNEKCKADSELYWSQLTGGKPEKWALQMLDSSGSFPPSGIMFGNLQSIGQYEECLAIDDKKMKGRHCVTYVYINQEKSLKETAPKQNREGNTTIDPAVQVAMAYLAQGKIHRGLCTPASCTYEDIEDGTNKFLRHLGMYTVMTEANCDAKGEVDITGADIAVITLLSVIVVLILLFTAIDVFIKHRQKQRGKEMEAAANGPRPQPGVFMKITTSFSLAANLKKIFTVKKGELDVLHGLRFFSMTWVILGHSYMMVAVYPLQNAEFVIRSTRQWILQMIFNAYPSVDTFFFMSGFLVAYVFYRSMKKTHGVVNVLLLVLKSYLYRYLRLTPVYSIVIAIAATIYYHFGNGPYWKTNILPMVEVCQQKWWTNLLYINNFVLAERNGWCIGQGWYLAVDMQFFLIAPIVTVPLLFRKRIGLMWAGFITAWSIIIPAVTIYINDAPPGVPAFNAQAAVYPEFLTDWYAKPWNRFSPYIIGLLCGYLYVKKPKRCLLNLPIALIGWFLAVGIGIAVVFGMYRNFQLDGTYTMAVATMYGCLHRVAWSVCIAWIVFACTQGYGGPVNSLLSWSAFVPLSRMSYCSYLVAMHTQYWFVNTRLVAPYYDHPLVMYTFFGHVILTHLIATLFTVCFESPCIGLTKLLLEGSRRPPPPKPKPEETPNSIENGTNNNNTEGVDNPAFKDDNRNS